MLDKLDQLLGEWLNAKRELERTRRDGLLGTAAIVSVLIATVAYTALLSVPGAWSPTACSGAPTSDQDTCAIALDRPGFKLFMYSNACALGFALGTVSIVVVLTMNPNAPEDGTLAPADRFSGYAALMFVIAGVISLVVSSVGAYKIILPYSWHVPAITLVVLVSISISTSMLNGVSMAVDLWVNVLRPALENITVRCLGVLPHMLLQKCSLPGDDTSDDDE